MFYVDTVGHGAFRWQRSRYHSKVYIPVVIDERGEPRTLRRIIFFDTNGKLKSPTQRDANTYAEAVCARYASAKTRMDNLTSEKESDNGQ
ncbi:hypothetical protein LCGC14_1104210 [marine sediment metagenome]|uniref:Uncharacterized protein n=1 Tax=marine sediment metagenome TaxID=412755 RepID=A0A0F9MD85_9ZZZZ